MDSFEFNKIAGAVLGTMLSIMVISEIGNFLVKSKKLEKNAVVIVAVEDEPKAGAAAAASKEPDKPIAQLLASANAANGEKEAKKCAACHTFDKGGANRVGPNLYDSVGAKKGKAAGFAYSDGLLKTGGEWNYESLDKFLKDPKGYAPGTKMAFAGVRKAEDRASLILYMRSLSDAPKPLPN
ncbi:MAG: cytochrome c family protein [Alphaproteobacteria bacterium]|nr:cytochrome c family protein [Alphaproteobacteria bacterium]